MRCYSCGEDDPREVKTDCGRQFVVCGNCDYGINEHTEGVCDCRAEFLALVTAYKQMPGHGTGGPLHIVLDDMNIAKHHIRWCVEQWLPAHPCSEVHPGTRYAGHDGDCMAETKQIADILLALRKKIRYEWIEAWWQSDEPRKC